VVEIEEYPSVELIVADEMDMYINMTATVADDL